MSVFAVTILGNNSAMPMHDRHPTSQVISYYEQLFLVDCGEATQLQMNRYKIRRNRIRHIFISHLHGDHYFGLPGLLNSYGLNNRTEDLWLYAPAALMPILDLQFKAGDTHLPFKLHFVPLEEHPLLFEDNRISVSCFPVKHRIPCWGFLFKEKRKPLKLDGNKLKRYDIPASFYHQLKEGADYITPDGAVIPNTEIAKPAPPALSYAYCADTAFDESIALVIKGSDMVYHETTYLNDNVEKAALRAHATTGQAATIARLAGAKKLLVGHFSSRYEFLDEFLIECQAVFPNSELALEGATYMVQANY